MIDDAGYGIKTENPFLSWPRGKQTLDIIDRRKLPFSKSLNIRIEEGWSDK